MGLNHKSQSALEYMMTYGWAILVIVIVAAVLYSLGIFSPSSSLSTTITGFSGLGVTQAGCVNSVNNQILELYVTNTVGYPVNITKINTTGNNGIDASQNVSSILGDGDSAVFYVNGACNKSSSYAGSATITYTEPGQVFPGPYFSTGKVANVLVSPNSNLVASFNGVGGTTASYITNKSVTSPFPIGTNIAFTVTAWIKPKTQNTGTDHAGIFVYGGPQSCPGHFFSFNLYPSSSALFIDGWCNGATSSLVASTDVWDFVAYTVYNGLNGYAYIADNGGSLTSSPLSFSSPEDILSQGPMYIGFEPQRESFNGSITNVQAYSFSLSQTQITQIYNRGIGGAPISGVNLVGWWPLDGNANDYSGNNNNGVATNVNWVSP